MIPDFIYDMHPFHIALAILTAGAIIGALSTLGLAHILMKYGIIIMQ